VSFVCFSVFNLLVFFEFLKSLSLSCTYNDVQLF
jgi:hypothetical protein